MTPTERDEKSQRSKETHQTMAYTEVMKGDGLKGIPRLQWQDNLEEMIRALETDNNKERQRERNGDLSGLQK